MKVLLDFVVGAAVGWTIICLLVKLITMCFGLTFTWAIGTGIYLIVILIRYAFNIQM